MAAAVDWSGAPDDVLVLLAEGLPSLADSVRFGAACRSLASAAAQRRRGTYIPYLLVPADSGGLIEEKGDDRSYNNGRLFCLSSQKFYRGLRFPEEARHWHCFGSCHAWLAMVDLDTQACLMNPMSGARVRLPSLFTFPDIIDVIEWPPQKDGAGGERRPLLYLFEWLEPDEGTPADQLVSGLMPFGYDGTDMRDAYMGKVCMSSPDPQSDPNCVVMVTYSGMRYLAYCKPGRDTKWTPLETPWGGFDDITYHRGRFYAVNHGGRIVVVDGLTTAGDGGPVSARQVAPLPPCVWWRKYLVGLPSGELLFITRDVQLTEDDTVPNYHTTGFRVFKIDIGSSRPRWSKVDCLGEFVLFVGHNSSVLISSSRVAPGACRANCIYFTDDCFEGYSGKPFGGYDMGAFHMETKSIQRYYPSGSHWIMPPPMWILPNPR